MAVVLILIMAFAQAAFADGGLQIVKTVPDNGESGKQPANMAVKIYFNEDVSDTANDAVNAYHIKIRDAEGKIQYFELVHHPKSPDQLWCVLKSDLTTNTEYTVTVTAGLKANSGNTLTNDYTFTFKTRNTKTDNTISVVLTFAMMGIMIFATMRATTKQEDEKTAKGKGASAPEKLAQADPYKLAKAQGISVDEAKAIIAKEKEKLDKRNAHGVKAREKYEADKAAKEAEIERRLQEIHDASVYKVKAKSSLAAHGGTIPKAVLKKQAAKRKASSKKK